MTAPILIHRAFNIVVVNDGVYDIWTYNVKVVSLSLGTVMPHKIQDSLNSSITLSFALINCGIRFWRKQL